MSGQGHTCLNERIPQVDEKMSELKCEKTPQVELELGLSLAKKRQV
jgi:hypothetical protein